MFMQNWLPSNLENVFSQFGEDSILKAIFDRIPANHSGSRTCVEFGAWDGLHFSNTANLIRNEGWKGLYIESDTQRFLQLTKNFETTNTTCINARVDFEGNSTLDQILSGLNTPLEIDLISIDIDGCDYWVLESIEKYLPKVFVVEFNPTIPNSVEYIQPRNLKISHGSSLKAICLLAKQKGYELVATTLCNAFLVQTKFATSFLVDGKEIDDFYQPLYSNSVWTAYDGIVMLEKDLQMPWQNLRVSQEKIQVLPKLLRKFPDTYNALEKFLFKAHSKRRKLKKLWIIDDN